jgi:hypothetical protein
MDDSEDARFRIYALQDGAVRAQALAFVLKVGLFDALEDRSLTFREMAEACALPPRVLPTLLAFLSSQALIERQGDGTFRNTVAASRFLVRSSPRYVGGRGLLFSGFYGAIGHLPEALATGMPWTPEGQHDMFAGFGPAEQQWFADGMFANAVHGARLLADQVDFSKFSRLLDVGGSAGGYTIALTQANHALTATIFDLEPLRTLAGECVSAAGLQGRVAFVAGSFFEDMLPRGHDLLLLSSILHDWGDADCATILHNCFVALDSGGTIIVTEPMLAEDFTGPDHPAASGLTMVVLGGENRTRSRISGLLQAAGFDRCSHSELLPQNSVVTARKP